MPSYYCLRCGHDLDWPSGGSCPECGRCFDPRDASSVGSTAEHGKLRRWALRSLGWRFGLLLVLCSTASILADSVPGGLGAAVILSVVLWIVLFFWYSCHVIAVLRSAETFRAGFSWLKHGWIRETTPPVLFLVLIVACSVGLPQRAVFLLSRPAMDRLVQQHLTAGQAERIPDQWVGLYYAKRIQRFPGGLKFEICNSGGPFIGYGFACSSNHCPMYDQDDWIDYRHFSGSWYVGRTFAMKPPL